MKVNLNGLLKKIIQLLTTVLLFLGATKQTKTTCFACQDHYYGAYYHKNIYNLHKLKVIHDCPSVLPLKEVAFYIDFRSEFTAKIENYGKSLDGLCERFQDELLDSYIRYGWKLLKSIL